MSAIFPINEHITLKLENNQTNIYVNSELFNHCKYLLLNIPVDKIEDYNEIDSIDEATEYLSKDNEADRTISIPPQVEFWGHCSNLQAWYENDYDSRLLHSNLAFPLLKKLSEYDSRAKIRFQEELAIRLKSGSQTVQEFLFNEYFNDIIELDEDINFNNLNIESLIMPNMKLNNFPDINKLKKLTNVYMCGNKLQTLPDSILKLEHLKCLNVCNNNLHSLPKLIGNLENLEVLSLVNNKIISLPESITKLKNLKKLYLSNNNLSALPNAMSNLNNLKLLKLSNNKLKHSKKVLKKLKKELPLCEVII